MIPLRDSIPTATVPFVTYLLIGTNIAVFLHQLSLGSAVERFIYTYGLVPRRLGIDGAEALPLFVTSMFLHAGWAHLLGNMLYLRIFGDNVEDRLGHVRFLALYLLAGVSAGIAQIAIDPTSRIPMVGASGAIAGVTGAYFLFYPRAKVITLVPVFIFLQLVEIPAIFFLFIWFAFQLMLGIGSLGSAAAGGVAFWAHVGGFVTGMVLGPALTPAPPRRVRPVW